MALISVSKRLPTRYPLVMGNYSVSTDLPGHVTTSLQGSVLNVTLVKVNYPLPLRFIYVAFLFSSVVCLILFPSFSILSL